jgi:KDO2-lipid IV(A) lauroyltransferase
MSAADGPASSRQNGNREAGRAAKETSLARFLGPRYWPLWFGLALLRAVLALPFRTQLAFGRALGRLAHVFARRDRRIADINIRLCFPDLDAQERQRLIVRHFESLGCALVETALVWWTPRERLQRYLRVEGVEHAERALRKGKGVLLMSAHFTTLEMGAAAAVFTLPGAVVYQTPQNPLIAELSLRGRRRHTQWDIASDKVRELLHALKSNRAVWYAPDQREEGRSMALVPFFGVPVATNIATSRLARLSGAPVLPYFPERLADGSGYVMHIGAPLENFPSGDPMQDALQFHHLIEAQVRRVPEQYLWTYKRFKTIDSDPYRRDA